MGERFRLDFLLWEAADQTRIELGPAFIHSYLPTGNVGATSASGNLFSGALYLSVD